MFRPKEDLTRPTKIGLLFVDSFGILIIMRIFSYFVRANFCLFDPRALRNASSFCCSDVPNQIAIALRTQVLLPSGTAATGRNACETSVAPKHGRGAVAAVVFIISGGERVAYSTTERYEGLARRTKGRGASKTKGGETIVTIYVRTKIFFSSLLMRLFFVFLCVAFVWL